MCGVTRYQVFPGENSWKIYAIADRVQVFDRLTDTGAETMTVQAGQRIRQTLDLAEPESAAQMIYSGAVEGGLQLTYGHRFWLPRTGACLVEFDCSVGASGARRGRKFCFRTRRELAASFFFAGEAAYWPLPQGFVACPGQSGVYLAGVAEKWLAIWHYLTMRLGRCRFARQTVLYWPLAERLGLSAPGAGCAVDGGVLLMPRGDETAEAWLMAHEAAHQWRGRGVRPEDGPSNMYEDIAAALADDYVKSLRPQA